MTGDPSQSDIGSASALQEVMERLESVPGIGMVTFNPDSIVRHKLVGDILARLSDTPAEMLLKN